MISRMHYHVLLRFSNRYPVLSCIPHCRSYIPQLARTFISLSMKKKTRTSKITNENTSPGLQSPPIRLPHHHIVIQTREITQSLKQFYPTTTSTKFQVSPGSPPQIKCLLGVLIFHEARHVIQSNFSLFYHNLPSSCLFQSKFPGNPDATHAFQKVAVAYDVLSKPTLRRLYDNRSPSSDFDVFATRPMGHAEETFKGVILGVFNDFLDGDLEVIRTLLSLSDNCHNLVDTDLFFFSCCKRYQPLHQTW